MKVSFPCNACGACCRSPGGSALYEDLGRSDGVCQHLDEVPNLCRIYTDRPSICRVSDMYERFADRPTWPEYVALNVTACDELRARTRREGE